MHSLEIAKQLDQSGFSIWPDFLSKSEQVNIRNDIDEINKSLGFHRAGTGQNEGADVRDLVRRDEIHWLNRMDSNKAQDILWNKLDSLKQAFNRSLYQGITDFEGHYSSYPEGGFYKRHLDSFQNDKARVISVIIYLNNNWQTQDAGQLRIYSEGSHIDVDPIGGTLVCFLSNECEHEVLRCNNKRYSFAGWFKR